MGMMTANDVDNDDVDADDDGDDNDDDDAADDEDDDKDEGDDDDDDVDEYDDDHDDDDDDDGRREGEERRKEGTRGDVSSKRGPNTTRWLGMTIECQSQLSEQSGVVAQVKRYQTNPTSPLGREWFREIPFPTPFFPFGKGFITAPY